MEYERFMKVTFLFSYSAAQTVIMSSLNGLIKPLLRSVHELSIPV